ncbi:MAG: hypothetical protein J6S50_10935 [Oscillospiraceae bacterium]|nr:hypothetical protein [Oscillospiraceae bacterium]
MAIEKKERYIVTMEDGTRKNVVAASFQECLAMFGEENVSMITKLEYQEEEA